MTGALILVSSGLLVLTIGHVPLQRISHLDRDPRVAIIVWMLTVVGAVGSITVGVVMLLLPNHAGVAGLLSRAGSCLVHLGHGGLPSYEESVGVLTLLMFGAAATRFAIVSVRLGRARRRKREHHRFLIATLAVDRTNGDDVIWLHNSNLIAYSISGRPGLIVASCGVRERLPPSATAATLEHERAHLKGRHHLLLASASNLRSALPFVPLLRHAAVTLAVLVEYAADSVAAERCGRHAVQSALLAFIGAPTPRHGLGIAGETLVRRLDRLETSRRRTPKRRVLVCGVAGAAAILVPIAVSTATFLSIACPAA